MAECVDCPEGAACQGGNTTALLVPLCRALSRSAAFLTFRPKSPPSLPARCVLARDDSVWRAALAALKAARCRASCRPTGLPTSLIGE